jgi:hypothetical protein
MSNPALLNNLAIGEELYDCFCQHRRCHILSLSTHDVSFKAAAEMVLSGLKL